MQSHLPILQQIFREGKSSGPTKTMFELQLSKSRNSLLGVILKNLSTMTDSNVSLPFCLFQVSSCLCLLLNSFLLNFA